MCEEIGHTSRKKKTPVCAIYLGSGHPSRVDRLGGIDQGIGLIETTPTRKGIGTAQRYFVIVSIVSIDVYNSRTYCTFCRKEIYGDKFLPSSPATKIQIHAPLIVRSMNCEFLLMKWPLKGEQPAGRKKKSKILVHYYCCRKLPA